MDPLALLEVLPLVRFRVVQQKLSVVVLARNLAQISALVFVQMVVQ